MNVQIYMILMLCLGAVWSDLKWLRIDNGYLLTFLILETAEKLLTAAQAEQAVHWAASLAGLLLPLLLLGAFQRMHMIGGGDLKLLAVLGWSLEMRILPCMWWTFVIAAVLSLAILADEQLLGERLRYLQTYVREVLVTGRRIPYRKAGFRRECLHMTVPVALSVLLWAAGVY